jgi:transposase-like protein
MRVTRRPAGTAHQLVTEPDALRSLVEHTVNQILSAEVVALCGAGRGERGGKVAVDVSAPCRSVDQH